MNRQTLRTASAALLALLALASPVRAEIVVLSNGKRIEGAVADRGETLDVTTRYGTLTVRKAEVRKIVRNLSQLTDPVDALRRDAEALRAKAAGMTDPSDRQRALADAVRKLEEALRITEEARDLFPGAEFEHLDRDAVAIVREQRICRDAMAAAPSAKPSPAVADPAVQDIPVPRPPSTPSATPADPQAARWLADARKASEARRYADARYIAGRILQQYPETDAAAEAQALLETIPHPDGRLVCGFDAPADLRAWRVVNPYKKNMVFETVTDPKAVKEGKGSARLALPRDPDYTTGAIVMEMGGFDETRVRAVSFWLHQERPSAGRLEVAFIRAGQESLPWIDRWGGSELGACMARAIPLDFTGWKKVTIALPEFQPRGASGSGGKIGWRDAGALVLYDASRKGLDVVIDGLRFLEAGPLAAR